MEAMLAVVAPSLFPALEKSLQVAFVTGYAVSWKLNANSKPKNKALLPTLPSRGRPRRHSSRDEEARPKAPPNDPQRQGNIWHRYEQLESMTKSLATVNKQMVVEKTKHQRAVPPDPHIIRLGATGRKQLNNEKKRLEEALLELQRVNEGLLDAARLDEGPPTAVHTMSAESAQLLGELRSRQRVHYCPISGLERSSGSPSVQAPKDENTGAATAEQAQAIARLQKQLAESQDRRKQADESTVSLKAEVEELRSELAAQTQTLALQVETLTAENDALQSQTARQRSTQASEVKSLELTQRELHGRLEDLADEKKLLQEQLSKANLAALDPDISMLRTLTEQNKVLTVRNAHLEAEVAGEGRNERLHELEQAMADVKAENARLQAKMLRLHGSASAVAAAGELLEQLKKDNADISADNERLLNYVESLESTEMGGLTSGTPRGHRKLLENFVQLKVDNKLLSEENARLGAELAEVQHARRSITTIPVPVRVDTGEAVDRELWVLLEELQERNQALAAENTALRARTPAGSWNASEAELAAECERLQRQLHAVMEVRAAEINADNLRLVNYLTEENLKLEQENQRVIMLLASSAKSENRGVLKDILNNVERLRREKAKALSDNAELAKRNTRLIEESEALLMRCQASGEGQAPCSPASKRSKKSFFPFRKSTSKSVLPVHPADGDGATSQDSPHSQGSSCSSFPGRGVPADTEGVHLECAHLRQENSRLLAENRQLGEQASMVPGLTSTNATLTAENSRLNDRMAKLVQDLTEENKHLLDENQRLNDTVQKVLSENAELSSRLIDVALTSDNDIFEAAFGGDDSSNGNGMATMPLGHWSQEATQKRRQEAQEEILAVGRQQAARQQQRSKLTQRANTELKAYEQARTSAEHAYSKSKALALQRLNSRNSQLLRTSLTGTPAATPQPGSAAATAAPSTPEQADDRAPFPDDGQYEEAIRRRKEAELSRAQLQHKIESLKQARSSGRSTDEATKAARPASASSQRAKAEAAHRKVMARREAESKVRACYFRFAGNCDVAAFMQALGYDMAASKDASPAALFHAAVQVAQTSKQESMSQDKQFLAEASISKLQEWLAEVQKEVVADT